MGFAGVVPVLISAHLGVGVMGRTLIARSGAASPGAAVPKV